jgi:hypothetical protein
VVGFGLHVHVVLVDVDVSFGLRGNGTARRWRHCVRALRTWQVHEYRSKCLPPVPGSDRGTPEGAMQTD